MEVLIHSILFIFVPNLQTYYQRLIRIGERNWFQMWNVMDKGIDLIIRDHDPGEREPE